MANFRNRHAWTLGLLIVLTSQGCSNPSGHDVVARDTDREKLVAASQKTQPTIGHGSQPIAQRQNLAARSKPRVVNERRGTVEKDPVQPASHRRTVLASHSDVRPRAIRQATVSRPRNVSPAISSLHLQRIQQRRSSLGTKLETPALIFTTIPPKAEGEVAALLEELRSGDTLTCREAIYLLGKHGSAAAAAAPALTVMVKDRDHLVRVHAALALWRITGHAEFSVPTLADAVNYGQPEVRAFSSVALSEIGPAAKGAIPSLHLAIEKNPGKIRVQAAEALWRIVGNNEKSLQAIMVALQNSDPEVRWAAAYALGDIAPNHELSVAALASRLRDSNDGVRVAAAYALGEIGPPAQPVISMLISAVRDPNQDVRQAAAVAIKQIEP